MTSSDPIQLSCPEALDAWEPLQECLIGCEIFSHWDRNPYLEGHQAPPKVTWVARTYKVWRTSTGWFIDFGEGGYQAMPSWERVVSWFCRMNPRKIEVLLDQMVEA